MKIAAKKRYIDIPNYISSMHLCLVPIHNCPHKVLYNLQVKYPNMKNVFVPFIVLLCVSLGGQGGWSLSPDVIGREVRCIRI